MTIAGQSGISDFFSLSISEVMNGHHSFNVSIPLHIIEGTNQTMRKSHELIGESFHVELSDELKRSYKFDGIITNINFIKSAPHEMSLNIIGMSPTIVLDDHEFTKSFLDKNLSFVFKDVVSKYTIQSKVKCNPIHSEKISYSVQYRETPFQYINRLTSEYGEWFYYNGEKLIIGKFESVNTQKLVLGDELYSYGFNMQATPLKDSSKSYFYVKNETFESSSQHKKVKKPDPFTTKLVSNSEKLFSQKGSDILEPKFKTKKELEKYQEYFKAGLISSMQVLHGNSSNHMLHVGSIVDIVGTEMIKVGKVSRAKEFNIGKYIVTSISHSVGREGDYMNNFSAIPAKLVHPASDGNRKKPTAFKQIAEVIDNKDKENMGRIVVRFPWMESNEKSPWLRVSTSHAHKDRGVYFIPEIGDEVLVDFEGGDADCPIVISSLFHGKAKPAKWYDKDNNIKAIRTKSGNELVFFDKKGKEAIEIFNSEKTNIITLTMEGQKLIRIESAGDIELEAKNINMKADNISMNAKKDLKTQSTKFENKSTDMNFNAQKGLKMTSTNFESKANASTKIESGATCDVKAASTKVEGSAKLDLKGGAMASLTGGIVKIN
jgi:uncharacterized protein involved in type VI secretion and phage assembly